MKTCEEYILKQYLEQDKVIREKNEIIEALREDVNLLKNPISEVLEEDRKVDCITLYKSTNVIYDMRVNTSLYQYKEAFESVYANGKITLNELKKALDDDETLDKINSKFTISSWGYDKKMYQFEPVSYDVFELNIDKFQYLIWGNYENLNLSRLNDFDEKKGFFYEKYKDQCLEKARVEVRKVLKDTIEYLEKKEEEKNES